MENFMFTSESVNEGHPDKLADQVCVCVGRQVMVWVGGRNSEGHPNQTSWLTRCGCECVYVYFVSLGTGQTGPLGQAG